MLHQRMGASSQDGFSDTDRTTSLFRKQLYCSSTQCFTFTELKALWFYGWDNTGENFIVQGTLTSFPSKAVRNGDSLWSAGVRDRFGSQLRYCRNDSIAS